MKKYVIMLIVILPFGPLYGQCADCEVQDGAIWVIIDQNKVSKIEGIPIINDDNMLTLFEKYKASALAPVFPSSKIELLKKVYEIKFEGRTDDFVKELNLTNNGQFHEIIALPKENKIAVYDPSDYMWQSHSDDWLWHLSDLQADLAWDITKGDTAIKVAVLDTWFDINHLDLEDKIFPHFDPYDSIWFTTNCTKNNHGTQVASFIAAHTDGGGQLAGMGFNSMIIPYKGQAGNYLSRAHHASLTMDADVLTSSAGGWVCDSGSSTLDSIQNVAVDEIIAHGTIIVMPAGNGPHGTHCPINGSPDTPFYPLHPRYDTSIIIVTSIGPDNNHYYYDSINDNREETHSHYAEVDICAPGYNVMGAICTEVSDTCNGVPCCVTNSWPYYGFMIGTSFATPIVAGVCALMKSIDPCLTQAEAQSIIKSTADAVNDASSYSGLIGAGRINAYEAVKETGTFRVENQTITSNNTYSGGFAVHTDELTIQNSAYVTFKARKEIVFNKTFELQSGSTFYAYIDASAQNTCD